MKKIFLIFLIFISSYSSWFAIDARVQTAYDNFLKNIKTNYSASKQELVLESLKDKLNTFKYDDKYQNLLPVISDLQSLNNETLYDIWLDKELSQSNQQIVELRERKSISPSMDSNDVPSYVKNIFSKNRTFVESDHKREYVENWNIFRINYSQYFPIKSNNTSAFKSKSGIIIFDEDSWEYRFVEDYSFDKKIAYSQMPTLFLDYFTSNHKVSEKQGNLYAYNFEKFSFYNDNYWAYQSQLDTSGFDYSSTILYKGDDGSYNFVTKYDKYLIGNNQAVFWVYEKHLFLDYLREDTKYQTSDISSELESIKSISKSLTTWVSKEQWIHNIYNWILSNIEYSQIIDLSDEKIFSWIETFKNKSGVCTWYTKLSSYLYYFAWYYDVEVIRGHVIDAEDFPQIGHAWLRIWDRYYDPTFDDPIWAKNTKTIDQYKYFWLPKDIFYANRFEYWDLPENFKTASKWQIDQHIFNTLSNLIPKYQNSLDDYPVFAQVNFKNKYDISAGTTITPDVLTSKIWNYSIENDSFKFQKNWTQKAIKHIRYYTLTDQNTESVLDIFWYDTTSLTLFDWQINWWDQEWRLAYELELQ
jgi:hypothetical protein